MDLVPLSVTSLLPETYFRGTELDAARAIATGNPAALERVLTFKLVNPNAVGEGGMTLLLFALAMRQHACLPLLLNWKANPNLATNLEGGQVVQPVALAAEGPDLEPLRRLLACGGDPNSRYQGEPALFSAIYTRNWPALRLLAEHQDINLNLTKPGGATPILLLAYFNQFEQVVYLLNKGADFARADDSGGTVAFLVQTTDLAPESAAHMWQQRLRQQLELRGVKFPVPDPSVEWEQKQAAEQKQREQWNRTPDGQHWNDKVNQAAAAETDEDDGVALMQLRQAAQAVYEQWQEQQATMPALPADERQQTPAGRPSLP